MRVEDRRLPGEGIPQRLFLLTYHVERRIREHFRGTGLHWGLRRILQRLWIEDGLSQKELSESVGSSETSISNMIKKLADAGWIERRQDDYDYRISRVYLTSKCKALREAIHQELVHLDGIMREELGASDSSVLEQLLENLETSLQSKGPIPDPGPAKTLADTPSPPGQL